MTNIFSTPQKVVSRDKLLQAGYTTLEKHGWILERVPGIGKSSVRRIRRGSETKIVSIKTTQDQWLAFSRTPDDKSWSTLEDVDSVVVISVDDRENPRFANVHIIDSATLVERFNRAYTARKAAGHSIPVGRGVWISLYEEERELPLNLIAAGVANDFPMIAKVPLEEDITAAAPDTDPSELAPQESGLTIPEAKRRLAITFGVDASAIRISVEA